MKQQRRRWWTRLVTVIAVLTVLAATLSVLFGLAIDAVPGYRTDLEGFVARSVGHPARIGSMALTWRRLRPTLELRDVALLDQHADTPLLEARRLSLGISLPRLLGGNLTPNRIEASGIRLDADIDANGRASLRGFDSPAADDDHGSLLADLARFDSIRVLDSTLLLHDRRLPAAEGEPAGASVLAFQLRSASIEHSGKRTTMAAMLDPPAAMAHRVNLHAVLDGAPAAPSSWHGDARLEVQQIAGWPWLASGLAPGVALAFERSSLQVNGHIEAGRVQNAVVDVRLGSVIARQRGQVRAQLADLALKARAQVQEGDAWRIDAEQFAVIGRRGRWTTGRMFLTQAAPADGRALHFEAGLLRLDDLGAWASLMRTLPASAARLHDLQGDAESVALSLTPHGDDPAQTASTVEISAHLQGAGLAATPEQPGLSGLQGELEGTLDNGRLVLDGSPLRLQLPALFEQDVAIESLNGELAWERTGEDWRLSAPALDLKMLGTTVEGDGALRLPGGNLAALPLLSLHLRMRSADAAVLKPLMPKTWGPNTRSWLMRALTRARITQGELKIDAPMTPRAADGHITMPWRLDLDVADAELDYTPGWPVISALTGQLHFHDGGMEVDTDSGQVSGIRVTSLRASIADFQTADLTLDGSLKGDGADFYKLLRNSPLQTRLGSLLHITEASGPVMTDVHLRIPLHIPDPPVMASGEVRFDNAQLAIRGIDQPLRALRGRLAFGGTGMTAEAITGTLYDTALTARIRTEPGAADGVLLGEFAFRPGAATGLEAAFVPTWLRDGVSGQTTMQLRLPFSGPDSGVVSLSSDLRGVTSQLPPPLTKQADDSLPLKIAIGGDPSVPLRVQITVGDALRASMRFAESEGVMRTRGIELRVGSGAMPSAEADGFAVIGAPTELDLASWLALIGAAQAGSGALPFMRADLQPERLVYRSTTLGRTHLLAVPAANNGIHVDLDGAASGQIDWLPGNGGRVQARLSKLALAALPQQSSALEESSGEPSRASPFDPGTAPVLDLDCVELTLGDVNLGHLGLVTVRVADGQRIEKLQLADGKLVVDAQGSWFRRAGANEPGSSADLSFDVRSTDISDVLRVFGYAPNLKAKEAHFSGQLAWPRVPEGLELAQAEGKVALDIKRGTLKSVEPGAGRVLGLINLYALPRRLLFDFRDVVSEGLAFDTLTGTFTLAGGDADTRDVQILGPQAKVRLEGRIGLAARDYDQRVIVTPDISTGVTLGATLLGGPIGGGIALVAQQLFGKPFNRLARFSYRVTGSWANPEFKPEAIKGPDPAPSPQLAPPPGSPSALPPESPVKPETNGATGVNNG